MTREWNSFGQGRPQLSQQSVGCLNPLWWTWSLQYNKVVPPVISSIITSSRLCDVHVYIYICVFLQCENWMCLIICQKPLTSCLFSPPLLCMGHHLVHNHRFYILVKFAPKRWQILFDPHPTKGSFIRYSNTVVNNHVFLEIPFILKMMFLPSKCGFPCAANDVWIILELGTSLIECAWNPIACY
jgi:hypothetical protein